MGIPHDPAIPLLLCCPCSGMISWTVWGMPQWHCGLSTQLSESVLGLHGGVWDASLTQISWTIDWLPCQRIGSLTNALNRWASRITNDVLGYLLFVLSTRHCFQDNSGLRCQDTLDIHGLMKPTGTWHPCQSTEAFFRTTEKTSGFHWGTRLSLRGAER